MDAIGKLDRLVCELEDIVYYYRNNGEKTIDKNVILDNIGCVLRAMNNSWDDCERVLPNEGITDEDDLLMDEPVDSDLRVWYGFTDERYEYFATNYKKDDFITISEPLLDWNYQIVGFKDKKIILKYL